VADLHGHRLRFLTPPSEPDMRLSPHPALQGLATSRSCGHRFSFIRATGITRFHQGFPRCSLTNRPPERPSPGPLPPVVGFPNL
jgi:hypothetical protein